MAASDCRWREGEDKDRFWAGYSRWLKPVALVLDEYDCVRAGIAKPLGADLETEQHFDKLVQVLVLGALVV